MVQGGGDSEKVETQKCCELVESGTQGRIFSRRRTKEGAVLRPWLEKLTKKGNVQDPNHPPN